MRLNVALNYGGRAEIVDAARRAIREGIAADDLDEQRFSSLLYTAGQPDPDLLIRTSGEMRVSNFLLWQIAYAEIYVTETFWPDFRTRHLLEAILAYPETGAPLRRHQAVARGHRTVTRVLSGAVLLALYRRGRVVGATAAAARAGGAGRGAGDRGVLHAGRAPRRASSRGAGVRRRPQPSAPPSRGQRLASRRSSWRS